ncbi:hypothetical protein KDE12_03780 [Campylobacter sp. faydin G-105]|uniref:hypothetical protein n=1 Tax=Campylobacter anatolicus TaxID=2829105 RepID=UPI001B9D66A3|nr:hypothetical protein [Campylobacter anatolicus]MBR8461972.1 hypothetical protein [Campylobacter anatolicus]
MEISTNLSTSVQSATATPSQIISGSTSVASQIATQNQIFKSQQQNTTTSQTVSEAFDNLDKLVARVLDELKSASSTSKTAQILQQVKNTQIAPNLAKDMQNLAKVLEAQANLNADNDLKGLAIKLKEFLKPIADLSSAGLNEQIKNSGIMLEANLKDAITAQKLPPSIQKLLMDIKYLNNKELLAQIMTLANDENLDNSKSFSKLNTMLLAAQDKAETTLNNSSLKSLFIDVNKLDNMAKFLDKSLTKQPNADVIKNQISKILEFVSSLNDKISNLQSEKLNQNFSFISNYKDLKVILESLEKSLKGINNIGDEIGLVKEFHTQTDAHGQGTLQDKLESAARRLAQTLNIADRDASIAKINLDETRSLIKQLKLANLDEANITQKSSADITKTLSLDVKNTLLTITEKSQNAQINQMANKMLSQIEMHQMISSLQGGVQTYMPYIWDGVEGGSVAFKSGKKDKFYAQISLNFKKYGDINVMIGLIDKRYIDISIATQTKEFKELIKTDASELKQAISQFGLIVSNFNLKAMSKYELSKKFKNFDGFDVGYDKKI